MWLGKDEGAQMGRIETCVARSIRITQGAGRGDLRLQEFTLPLEVVAVVAVARKFPSRKVEIPNNSYVPGEKYVSFVFQPTYAWRWV